jgi:hypothetical protein
MATINRTKDDPPRITAPQGAVHFSFCAETQVEMPISDRIERTTVLQCDVNCADIHPTSDERSGVSDTPPASRLKITASFLLGICAIVPLCTVAMICDVAFWGGTMFRALPTNPESFFLFQLAFGTPHVIASSLILATNRAYVGRYWLRLLLFSMFLLLFFGVGSLFIPYNVFLAVVGAATVLHVIKQQVGIGKGICRLKSRFYDVWGWTLIVYGSILYYALYSYHGFDGDTGDWVNGLLSTLAAFATLMTVICHFRITTVKGRLYLWANAMMVLQSGLFYAEGYSFLAILGPRLVHDLTAFTFYVAHDVNRHGHLPQNLLYRAASKLGLSVFWVCPVVAVLLTFLLGRYADPIADITIKPILGYSPEYGASFLIVGYLAMLHYFTEVFTWKHGSPYRQYVAMAP